MGLLFNDDDFYYLLGDREFYEPADRRSINTADYIDHTLRRLPPAWTATRSGIWFHCRPPNANVPPHGWKIHVSATVSDAPQILAVASQVVAGASVAFKFAADRYLLLCLNRKRWARGGSGKFITAYPRDETQCRALMTILRDQLVGYDGPYILSDRRFADSHCVHYRYGGFQRLRRCGVDGRPRAMMRLGTSLIVDERRPRFAMPEKRSGTPCRSSCRPCRRDSLRSR